MAEEQDGRDFDGEYQGNGDIEKMGKAYSKNFQGTRSD